MDVFDADQSSFWNQRLRRRPLALETRMPVTLPSAARSNVTRETQVVL